MTDPDIRWKQRVANYERALAQLTKFIDKGELNELEELGLVHAFEYTYDLAWNFLKVYLQSHGNHTVYGSRDATRLAFNAGLITKKEVWMNMLQARYRTNDTYEPTIAQTIAENVRSQFFPLLLALQDKVKATYGSGFGHGTIIDYGEGE
jgi:nucleotidyltransferase substrate binding protein (TIGR01987 family)